MRWTVGDIEVPLVREVGTLVDPAAMYPGADLAPMATCKDWLQPDFATPDGLLTLSIHVLVLRSQGQVLLVDPCVGEHTVPGHEAMDQAKGDVLGGLAAIGITPEDVDVVLCTHLHFDHVGWNTRRGPDGSWVPTFPNARYLFTRADYEHWASGAAGYALTFRDAVVPVVAAGQADLVDGDHVVNDEIRFLPTPGHSPGHVAIQLDSRGERAVITGDLVHNPVQFVAMDWVHMADGDGPAARATRAAFREAMADSGTRIFGTHFGGPSTGFLRRDGDGYRFDT